MKHIRISFSKFHRISHYERISGLEQHLSKAGILTSRPFPA
jgi:hypothetical protein